MSLTVRTFDRQFSIHVYDKHKTNYISSCLINQQGDIGFFSLVSGKGFYLAAEKVLETCEERGITTLMGYVTTSHARLLKRITANFANVTIIRKGSMPGIEEMTLVEIRRK